jgi:hypothetical protein
MHLLDTVLIDNKNKMNGIALMRLDCFTGKTGELQ